MGHYVMINVSFRCSENDQVAIIAGRHAGLVGCNEAELFLRDLSNRSGPNPGPKGGMSTWGTVANWTSGDEFVTALLPFWKDLLEADLDGGPFRFHNILVFAEAEQTGQAFAFEISLDGTIRVTKHACPFAWSPA